MLRATETIDPGAILRGDPECQYKFLEARVAPSVDPSATVDLACFMTTDTVDADDEVVLPSGADLSRFEKNPVLMLCHAHGQPGSYYPLPIGKVAWTKKRPHGLMAGITFARSTAIGREVKGLFDEDMCRSFSIGFRSLDSSPMTWQEAETRPDWKAAYRRTSGRVLVHRAWSLLELSVAPIPSNEDALRARYLAKGLRIPDWIKITPTHEDPMIEAAAYATKDDDGDDGMEAESVDRAAMCRKVAAVAGTIKHSGGRGQAFYHHGDRAAHHTMADGDDAPEFDGPDAIKAKYLAIKGVKKVQVGDEWSPEEEDGWEQVHPARGAKALAEGSGTAGGFAAAPDEGEDVAEDDGPIRVHDHVKINAPHHKGVGLVKSIHKDGMVPDVDEDMVGTKAEPCARVKCFKAMDDGHVPTDHHIGVKCKHLEKCAPVRPPSKARLKAAKCGMGAGALPPLVALDPRKEVEQALVKLNALLTPESIRTLVAEELERRMGAV